MTYTTLISVDELKAHLEDPNWVILDCRFTLAEPEKGSNDYQRGHIPGAVYAHLENDLCSPIIPGKTGRHPLPTVDDLARVFSQWGITDRVQVVAYDDWDAAPGAIAARLWWTLQWLGHEAVAVLDGGWKYWTMQGGPVSTDHVPHAAAVFTPRVKRALLATSDFVDRVRTDNRYAIFDSRSRERYEGKMEPIDPIAGHIPGAVSAPYIENCGEDGLFLKPEALRDRFEKCLDGLPTEKAIYYCGSGVTGAHNVLALAHAGMGLARLYAGSWSEWITDPDRPIAVGE